MPEQHHPDRHRSRQAAPESHGHEHGHSHVGEDLLTVEDAFARIMACFRPLDTESKPLTECLGQVLAEDVHSPLDLPSLANSGMDGYAVQEADIRGATAERPRDLNVIGVVAAGYVSSQTVAPGVAIRIMTGAPIPAGADTVVPFEETDEVQRRAQGLPLDRIGIRAGLRRGSNLRPAGEDVRRGQLVLEAGTVIRPAEVGVLASLGLSTARVIRRPVVSILSTGDELAPAGAPLNPGKIYDANSASVAAAVAAAGGQPRLLGIAQDNLEDLNRRLDHSAGSDLIITSAGVSKGDYDIVKEVLSRRGDVNFWSVRMRPAKPLAFGMLRGPNGGPGTPLLGLPGNPVSALVAFEMFARPAILTMLGRRRLARPTVSGVLAGPIHNADGRRVYARVVVDRRQGTYFATPTGPQGSNILTSMSLANGLAVCPAEITAMKAGETVQIVMLDWNEEVDL
ncbi:MAG: molybdopterin molybdenumtransferase MoeA [Dehalococcoidia bacterium]|nr:molybdopterin molybdenumtransferase MoeA [Dehalococcoidia bacterium]MSQ17425.1 molybdopterin molybdenumtransferase MoeA [Dehalococcoidia bacterium]